MIWSHYSRGNVCHFIITFNALAVIRRLIILLVCGIILDEQLKNEQRNQ